MEFPTTYKKALLGTGIVFLAVLTVYFGVKIALDVQEPVAGAGEHTIMVTGHGEVSAAPDIANVSFTIMKDAKTVKDAQEQVAQVEKKVLDLLKADGVAEKDIKTQSASFNPKYEYVYSSDIVPCNQYGCPPRPGKNTITGYEAYESISLKVRNLDNTGKIIQDLGTAGVSNLNGPNFAIDNEDTLKAEARGKAIDSAKEKAQTLAKQLGVSLSGISSFSESGSSIPIMYKAAAMGGSTAESSAPAPAQLPTGENTISSNVTITYVIR